jgi:hypothetical protein
MFVGRLGSPYKDLAVEVEWKVIDKIGQAEESCVIQQGATTWFRRKGDEKFKGIHCSVQI